VLVVSKGDGELLKLPDRVGWHFPQDERGVYAGHHPASSEAAIAHLEALRVKGAGSLLIPPPSLWWLDHYAAFREHLERMAVAVSRDPAAGILFVLPDPPTGPVAGPPPARGAAVLAEPVDQLADLVASLVPPEAGVALAAVPGELAILAGRRVVVVQVGPTQAGPSLADRLQDARRRGAQFLVATKAAVRDDPEGALRGAGRLVTSQQHVGLVVDMAGDSAVPPVALRPDDGDGDGVGHG